jgi:hypothetical protein
MENNVEKILEKKQDEIHYINGIVKNLNYLKQLYSKGVLEDAKNLLATCNALKAWEQRSTYVETHIELIQSGITPEMLGNEVLDVFNSVENDLVKINQGIKGVYDYKGPNATKKEWLASIGAIQGTTPTLTTFKTVFFDDDIIKNVKGFMCGPVGVFNNKAVQAATKVFTSLQELKDWVKDQSLNNDMVIYMTFEENGKYIWRGDSILK